MQIKLAIVDLDDTVSRTTADLRGRLERIHHLTLTRGAEEFLAWYPGRKVLLTMGSRIDQETKIEILQIRRYFHQVVITEFELDKVLRLFKIVQKSRLDPRHIAVIGDRLNLEIRWGNFLGCHTIRMRLPDGKYAARDSIAVEPRERPEYTVADFCEVRQLPIFVS